MVQPKVVAAKDDDSSSRTDSIFTEVLPMNLFLFLVPLWKGNRKWVALPPLSNLLRRGVNASNFLFDESIENFVSSFDICDEEFVEYIAVEPCSSSHRIYMKPLSDCADFTSVYDYMFNDLVLHFLCLSLSVICYPKCRRCRASYIWIVGPS